MEHFPYLNYGLHVKTKRGQKNMGKILAKKTVGAL